ncbi:MAG TPA: YqgE/AlgH family protein [Actinomycetales bacterium]
MTRPDLTGQLLVATPLLREPTFHRTVILVLDHGHDGAMGVVLNRPMGVEVAAVLPDWQPHTTAPGVLFQGGPVGLDSALGLVAVPGDAHEPAGVRRLNGALGLVDLDVEPLSVVSDLSGLRVFAGYTGWTLGQLESEIEEGSWYVVEGEARDPFSADPDSLWRDVLRRQRGELAYVASYPDDPTHN